MRLEVSALSPGHRGSDLRCSWRWSIISPRERRGGRGWGVYGCVCPRYRAAEIKGGFQERERRLGRCSLPGYLRRGARSDPGDIPSLEPRPERKKPACSDLAGEEVKVGLRGAPCTARPWPSPPSPPVGFLAHFWRFPEQCSGRGAFTPGQKTNGIFMGPQMIPKPIKHHQHPGTRSRTAQGGDF